jgi:curved DNA-binding protein CbpA
MSKGDPDRALDREHLLAWFDVIEDANYYEILGVLEIADLDAIRRAFHDFSLAFHPDAQPGSDEEMRALSLKVFRRGVEAYQALSVPERRARYDLALARGELQLDVSESRRPLAGSETGARSLEDLCRSPGAKLYAKRAEDFITAGDLRSASAELYRALRAEEGENPDLVERIAALTTLARLSGAPDPTT